MNNNEFEDIVFVATTPWACGCHFGHRGAQERENLLHFLFVLGGRVVYESTALSLASAQQMEVDTFALAKPAVAEVYSSFTFLDDGEHAYVGARCSNGLGRSSRVGVGVAWIYDGWSGSRREH
jgi:hypothetical protein